MTFANAEAAQLLGMKPAEVLSTVSVDEGWAVSLFDGTEVLVVPADRPDAEGQSGVMLRESPGAMNRLPVYVPFPVDEAVAVEPAEDDDDAEPKAEPAKRATKKAAVKKAVEPAEDDDDA